MRHLRWTRVFLMDAGEQVERRAPAVSPRGQGAWSVPGSQSPSLRCLSERIVCFPKPLTSVRDAPGTCGHTSTTHGSLVWPRQHL